ncbi:NADH-quinone oxidoreductase subunit K [bacterium]|nr:NADH-quinone oxidoreductase subunit K [bacterium]
MTLVSILGFVLIAVGLWGMLTRRNLIKIIVGFSIMDTGVHLVIVSLGFIKGRTAPIINKALSAGDAPSRAVDPIPSALVLTAIVIGLAVTALLLSFAVRIYREKRTLNIDDISELKW